jgi:SWI/SNF-related matrix-associated actin-dependent regulator 1 of chromatin subfamily A
MRPEVSSGIRPHQQRALEKALDRPGFALWAPPGAGKTLVGLVWLAASARGPRLVITRAAARETWREECERWTNLKPVILAGRDAAARFVPEDPFDKVYITAWETLIDWRAPLEALGATALCMDEIHAAKSHKRVKPIVQEDGTVVFQDNENQTAAARSIAGKAPRRLGLTATPIPNRTEDLWAQLDLCEPWAWGGHKAFGIRYCDGYHNGYGMVYKGTSNVPELNERLKYSKHRVSQAAIAAHLPPKRRQIVRLDVSEQDKPATGFSADIRKLAAELKRGNEEAGESLFETMLMEAATRKRSAVVERILEAVKCGQKVTVFTGRRADCDALGKLVEAGLKGTDVPLWVSHGAHPPERRDDIRRQYMAYRPTASAGCVNIGTGDAWGESLNLQDTDLALFIMLPWTPRQIRQWEGRFQRMGGTRSVLIQYFVAKGTVDEDVEEALLGKLPPIEQVVQDEALSGFADDFQPVSTVSLLDRISGIARRAGG